MPWSNVLWDEIFPEIEAVKKDEKLYHETNFNSRIQAIDYIEFHIIDRINALPNSPDILDPMKSLIQYANRVKCKLENINAKMFQQLRTKIVESDYKGKLLKDLINDYLDHNLTAFFQLETFGYDNLDIFLNGLLATRSLPVETKDREPEMVFYQKTPARIILKLITKANFKPTDIFFDLGSGLGHVNMLVGLSIAIPSIGVEFEPAFCDFAKACVADLKLDLVEFINTDARYADYSKGTVFFMYTPFEGNMLREVLQKLKAEAKNRIIKIFTYGPCTPKIAEEDWLINKCVGHNYPDDLGEFISQ